MAAPDAIACELVRDLVAQNGSALVRVRGHSMLPSVWPGDIVHVRRAGPEELARGQIVMFHREGVLRVHRIVAITREPWTIVTQGDCLLRCDAPLRPEQLIGAVVAIRREGRSVPARASILLTSRLLRFLTRFSDLPAYLLVRFRSAVHAMRSGSSATDIPDRAALELK